MEILLYVDKKKPNGLLNASRPPALRVLSSKKGFLVSKSAMI